MTVRFPVLEACPFCNTEPKLRSISEHYAGDADGPEGSFVAGNTIACDECGYSMAEEYLDDVVTRWNTRQYESRVTAALRPHALTWMLDDSGSHRTAHTPFGSLVVVELSDGRGYCVPFWGDRGAFFAANADACAETVEKEYYAILGMCLSADLQPTHRHKKRDKLCTLIGVAKMQAEGWFDTSQADRSFECGLSVDMREVVIYQETDSGDLWVRPKEEFEDGRFEELKEEE